MQTIMRVLLYPNREQEQAFERHLLGLKCSITSTSASWTATTNSMLEHISCRWEWDYLRESIR